MLLECDRVELYNATVMYLFRGMNYRTFGARITKLCGGRKPNVRAITETLSGNGYILKNLKIWMFYVVTNKLGQQDAMVLSRKWKIEKQDAVSLAYISKKTLAYMRSLSRRFAAYTLEQFNRLGDSIVTNREFIKWLGKFTSKKHRFVATSQSFSLEDIRKELMCDGIAGLYNMYPCMQSDLHALNIMKRTIHNKGINLIYHFTSQKAGRLLQSDDGAFHALTVSIESVRETLEMQPIEYDNDLKVDFDRLLDAYSGKKRTFLELLSGAYCPVFTAWLQKNGHRVDTNESLQEKLSLLDYAKKCLQFLGVKLEAGLKFLERLRSKFAPYQSFAGAVVA